MKKFRNPLQRFTKTGKEVESHDSTPLTDSDANRLIDEHLFKGKLEDFLKEGKVGDHTYDESGKILRKGQCPICGTEFLYRSTGTYVCPTHHFKRDHDTKNQVEHLRELIDKHCNYRKQSSGNGRAFMVRGYVERFGHFALGLGTVGIQVDLESLEKYCTDLNIPFQKEVKSIYSLQDENRDLKAEVEKLRVTVKLVVESLVEGGNVQTKLASKLLTRVLGETPSDVQGEKINESNVLKSNSLKQTSDGVKDSSTEGSVFKHK